MSLLHNLKSRFARLIRRNTMVGPERIHNLSGPPARQLYRPPAPKFMTAFLKHVVVRLFNSAGLDIRQIGHRTHNQTQEREAPSAMVSLSREKGTA